jgi:phosphopantothenoylcysteine synthetase/decarboxylase
MRCIVTAGPTYEPLDHVRRLTNFSTGRLGTELANHLHDRGHVVILLRGESAVWSGECRPATVKPFSSTQDLLQKLSDLATSDRVAVFHASAVSDFRFGRIWQVAEDGQQQELTGGKISSRQEQILAELVPTPKLINRLRDWFPNGWLVGWKYEVDGGKEEALEKAKRQLDDNHTDQCVVNGPAYGDGFGVMNRDSTVRHCDGLPELLKLLSGLPERS